MSHSPLLRKTNEALGSSKNNVASGFPRRAAYTPRSSSCLGHSHASRCLNALKDRGHLPVIGVQIAQHALGDRQQASGGRAAFRGSWFFGFDWFGLLIESRVLEATRSAVSKLTNSIFMIGQPKAVLHQRTEI